CLTTPSTSTAKISVATSGFRAHPAQPDIGELQRDLFAGGYVEGRLAQDRRGQHVKHHAADEALQGEDRMHAPQSTRGHLTSEVLPKGAKGAQAGLGECLADLR